MLLRFPSLTELGKVARSTLSWFLCSPPPQSCSGKVEAGARELERQERVVSPAGRRGDQSSAQHGVVEGSSGTGAAHARTHAYTDTHVPTRKRTHTFIQACETH